MARALEPNGPLIASIGRPSSLPRLWLCRPGILLLVSGECVLSCYVRSFGEPRCCVFRCDFRKLKSSGVAISRLPPVSYRDCTSGTHEEAVRCYSFVHSVIREIQTPGYNLRTSFLLTDSFLFHSLSHIRNWAHPATSRWHEMGPRHSRCSCTWDRRQ